jgi:hypothetical protein
MAPTFNSGVRSAPALCLRSDGTLFDICANEAGQQLSSDHLRLELCSHGLRETTCELQRSLLSPFLALVGPSAFVSVCGDVADRLEAEKLENSMRSNLICFHAFGWQTFKALDGLKALADATVQAGEYVVATRIYNNIIPLLDVSPDMWDFMPDIAPTMSLLMFETQFTFAYLQLKTGDTHSFTQSVTRAFEMIEPGVRDFAPIQAVLLHLRILAMSASGGSFELSPRNTVAECIATLVRGGSDKYRTHDIAILKRCADDSKIISPQDLPVASCSIHALPPKCISPKDSHKIPDHIVGYLDTKTLRETNKETRETINRLQVERGWHVTQFELYDPPQSGNLEA